MQVDLKKDMTEIRAMLVEGVRKYAEKHVHPKAKAKFGPVTAIAVVFDCGTGARVSLNFETRLDYEPDGTWTHTALVELDRPNWEQAYEALEEKGVQFILLNGNPKKLKAGTDDEKYIEVFGEALVSLLKESRDSGVFATLPRAPRCELFVEEQTGMFAWPWYENRGKDNLI
ncbi:MAG: hypothetical protein SGJ19_09795 [Planctomycetia bacterium]|mgnify:CR=1 FL=1|nr:hypothetical protein [Planctomycetia bacterium]